MKRAVAAAIVGLMAIAIPQAAFADHDQDRERSTQPEGTPPPEPDRGPPPGHPYGDREQHDDDEGTILF